MIGIFLIAIGQIFAEIGTSIGKYEAAQKRESLYAIGFLHAVWAMIFMLLLGLFWRGEFIFSLESLPTFVARAILEIILLFVGINAILQSDRSTFSFLHILTVPLLLITDITFGYYISFFQIIGICIIVLTLLFLLINHELSNKGKILSILTSVLAVGTISLYKYNITNFNSVEAEQVLMYLIIIITLIIMAKFRTNENLFHYLTNKIFFIQSFSSGIATVFLSFAYLFAPASVIVTAKRSLEIFAAMISGHTYFYEKHFWTKTIATLLITVGIILMIF
jgi:hypothetical protein